MDPGIESRGSGSSVSLDHRSTLQFLVDPLRLYIRIKGKAGDSPGSEIEDAFLCWDPHGSETQKYEYN